MDDSENKEEDEGSAPPAAPKMSAEELEEMRRLDALIIAGRGRSLPSGALQELRWMLYLTIVLLMLAIGSYMVPVGDRRVTALMVSIAGLVFSAWGAVRGLLTARAGGIAGIGWMYAGFFAVLALVFAAMMLGFTGVLK